MRITEIETITLEQFPNILFVEVHTDEGLTGLGETFYGARAVEAYVHETAAPLLLGQDPLRIEHHARTLYGYVGYGSSGAEMRGNSAIDAFLHRADELALSLVDEGFTGMKIWPFDMYAEASGGHYISAPDLRDALSPFRKIREAVGDRIDIMVEFHSLWDLPTARRICAALEEYQPCWFEDPLKADNLDALAALARSTRVPLTLSETIAGRWRFRELLDRDAAGVVMLDLSWVGGITEAQKVAAMAEAAKLPVAPHDCTGPVVLTASVHLWVSAPNALVQEVVRAFYTGWYRELVTDLPPLEDGRIAPLRSPGLGTRLQPDLKRRPGVQTRTSRAVS